MLICLHHLLLFKWGMSLLLMSNLKDKRRAHSLGGKFPGIQEENPAFQWGESIFLIFTSR